MSAPMNMTELLAMATGKKAEISARRGNDSKIQKIPDGKSKWRILPGWRKDARHIFQHDFAQHYIKDKDGAVKGVVVCEFETFGRPCPVCDGLQNLIRSTKDDNTIKLLKEMAARRQHLVNALRMDGDAAQQSEPVLLLLPGSVLATYLELLVERQTEDDINILDLKEGRNITINREGKMLTTKYSCSDAAKSTTIDESVLTKLIDIDAYIDGEYQRGKAKLGLFEPTAREIMAIGLAKTTNGGSSLVPASAAAALARPKPPVIDAEIVEEEEIDVDALLAADEEETAKPAPKKSGKAAKPAPADGDDLTPEDLDDVLSRIG